MCLILIRFCWNFLGMLESYLVGCFHAAGRGILVGGLGSICQSWCSPWSGLVTCALWSPPFLFNFRDTGLPLLLTDHFSIGLFPSQALKLSSGLSPRDWCKEACKGVPVSLALSLCLFVLPRLLLIGRSPFTLGRAICFPRLCVLWTRNQHVPSH